MIKRSIVWTFLFIAAGNGAGSKCYGQETDIQQSIESFTLQAMKYESMDNLDSASYFYQQLAKTYYENGQIDEYFNNYTNIADLFIKKGSYETAIQWLDSAGNQPFPTYPNENERLAMLEWYLFKAYCYEQQSDYVTAKSIYEAAQLNLVTEEIHEDYYVAQFLYQPLGNIYTRLGDYAAATNLLTKFKTISEEAGDLNAVAQATNDLGIVLKILQRYDEATENYLSALKYRNLDLATSGLLKSNLASTYLETNQPKTALQFANQAIVDFDRTLKNGNQTAQVFSYLAWTYNIIGQIYAFLEQYDQARTYYEESLNLSTQLFRTNKRREIAKINIGLGELALSTSDVERSMHHFQQALISVVPQFNNIDPANNPPDDQLLPENALFEALEGKARAYKLLYLSTGKLENLKYVVANYQLIRKVEVMIRQSYQNESSKLLLSGESHARSESALEAVHELYQLTGEDVYIEEAYQIIESNKATILLESIKDLKLKSFANIPDWILEREEILKNKQYSLQKLLSDALRENQSDSQSLKEIRSKLFQNKRALDLLNEKLKTDFPNYYLLKNEINLVNSLTDIKNQFIDETTDMIE